MENINADAEGNNLPEHFYLNVLERTKSDLKTLGKVDRLQEIREHLPDIYLQIDYQ